MNFQRIVLFVGIFCGLYLSGCGGGGGGDSTASASNNTSTTSNPAPVVAADYLGKYQGTWSRCIAEIDSPPMSVRQKLIVSAPAKDGSIQLDTIEEIFENNADCQSTQVIPLATIKEVASGSGKFSYTTTLTVGAVPGNIFDVLNIFQPQVDTTATGTNVSQVVINGVPTWRVRSKGTSVVDRPVKSEGFSGEVGFLFSNSGALQGLFLNDDTRSFTKAPI